MDLGSHSHHRAPNPLSTNKVGFGEKIRTGGRSTREEQLDPLIHPHRDPNTWAAVDIQFVPDFRSLLSGVR